MWSAVPPSAASCRSLSAAACATWTMCAAARSRRRQGFDQHGGGQGSRLVRRAAEKFGAQCIVVAIDAKRVSGEGDKPRFEIFTHGGREPTGIEAVAYARGGGRTRRRGNSADLDGPGRHARASIFDLTCAIADAVTVPVIASGGVGTLRIWSMACAKVTPRPCLPPRSSTMASTPSARPSASWRRQACRCGSTARYLRSIRPNSARQTGKYAFPPVNEPRRAYSNRARQGV